MLINEEPLRHWIDHFYGYGSWHAPLWFIAYEEGGGDLPEEVAEKINYFHRAHASAADPTLCDIRDLYKNVNLRLEGPKADLFTNRYDYRFGSHAIQHGVWKNIIAFEYGCKGEKLPDLLTHQKNTFVLTSEKKEALIQLYPLPSPHNHAWYYSWLEMPQLGFLKSRTLYEEHLYLTRMQSILRKMNSCKPEVVVMYGMNNIALLKQSVQEFFEGVKFKMVKAIKQQIPQHHRADFHGTTLLITTQIPALRHNRVESGFDWEKFGNTLRV